MKYSEYARWLGMIGAIGTTAGLLLWAGQATTGRTGDWLIVAGLFALPMLFIVIGLARRRTYTAAWACMLAVLYVGYTLAEHLINDGAAGVWLTLISSGLLFIGCASYPRLCAREHDAKQPLQR